MFKRLELLNEADSLFDESYNYEIKNLFSFGKDKVKCDGKKRKEKRIS